MVKSAIIIDPTLPKGLLANSVACITSGLFLDDKELIGTEIQGEGIAFIPITKIPILILHPGLKSLKELCEQARRVGLKYMAFTKEAQSTTNYEEYVNRVEGKSIEEVNLIGLGVIGESKVVNFLVGSLPMLR